MGTRHAPPRAILFGAIGTIAETSELQRKAYNAAFEEAGVPWHWGPEIYRHLVARSGGRDRIAGWARARGENVDASALHARKDKIYRELLSAVDLPLRSGVAEIITRAQETGTPLGLVTTSPAANVDHLLRAVWPPIGRADFATVITGDQVNTPKPSPDCYALALGRLGVEPEHCIAVEDTPDGVRAASEVGLRVIAFPGMYHLEAPFENCEGPVASLTAQMMGLDGHEDVARRQEN